MLLKEVSELLEERKRRTIWQRLHSNLLRTSKRERGAVGGASEAGESGVNKILFGYKQDFFCSNA